MKVNHTFLINEKGEPIIEKPLFRAVPQSVVDGVAAVMRPKSAALFKLRFEQSRTSTQEYNLLRESLTKEWEKYEISHEKRIQTSLQGVLEGLASWKHAREEKQQKFLELASLAETEGGLRRAPLERQLAHLEQSITKNHLRMDALRAAEEKTLDDLMAGASTLGIPLEEFSSGDPIRVVLERHVGVQLALKEGIFLDVTVGRRLLEHALAGFVTFAAIMVTAVAWGALFQLDVSAIIAMLVRGRFDIAAAQLLTVLAAAALTGLGLSYVMAKLSEYIALAMTHHGRRQALPMGAVQRALMMTSVIAFTGMVFVVLDSHLFKAGLSKMNEGFSLQPAVLHENDLFFLSVIPMVSLVLTHLTHGFLTGHRKAQKAIAGDLKRAWLTTPEVAFVIEKCSQLQILAAELEEIEVKVEELEVQKAEVQMLVEQHSNFEEQKRLLSELFPDIVANETFSSERFALIKSDNVMLHHEKPLVEEQLSAQIRAAEQTVQHAEAQVEGLLTDRKQPLLRGLERRRHFRSDSLVMRLLSNLRVR